MPTHEDRLLFIDAVRALPEPIFVVSSNGFLIDANAAALRTIGMTAVPREMPLASLVTDSPERLAQTLLAWAKTRTSVPGRLTWKTPRAPLEVPLEAWCARPASANSPALLVLQARPIDHAASRFIALNEKLETLTRDVLDRRRVESELVDALKARDDLVSVAAHELRNPLNVFHLTLQLLYRLSGDGASIVDVRRLLDRSRSQLARLSALVDRLLDVTRLRSGKFELDREPVDLSELAREVGARLVEEFPAAKITFEANSNPVGNWDRLRIDQALTNIISNAIKYGRNQPITVQISTRFEQPEEHAKEYAIVAVRDEGIGMSPQDLDRIFDRFERAAPRNNNEGLGLGLWITRRIAEAHRGSVHAVSQLGSGSIFTLSLPIDETKDEQSWPRTKN